MAPSLRVFAALALALGCSASTGGRGGGGVDGGDNDGPGDDVAGGGELTAERFVAAYYQAFCEAAFRCPSLLGGLGAAFLENPAACAERAPRLSRAGIEDLAAFARDGSARFDAIAARACLDVIVSSCVGGDSSAGSACRRTFVGTVPAGGGCWVTEQCAAGTYCEHQFGSARNCPGSCRPQAAVGERCTDGRQCLGWREGATTCALGQGRCANVRPERSAAEGQPCGRVENADGTVSDATCAAGTGCRGGVCRRPLPAGAPCVASQDLCASGAACAQRPGTTGTTCAPYDAVVRSAPGGACDPTGRAPVFCNITARLTCNATGTCESLGDGTRGSRCAPGDDLEVTTCNPGLRCDPATRVCVARAPVNGACKTYLDCASNACEDGRCVARICQ